jgi:hypothetical protein
MRSVVAVLATLLYGAASAAHAQPSKQCEEIAKNAGGMIGPAIVNLNRVESMGPQIASLRSTAAEELRPPLDRFDQARQDLAVALRQFIDASRALRDASEACS